MSAVRSRVWPGGLSVQYGPMFGGGATPGFEGGSMYGEVQCIMVLVITHIPVNRQTHTTENITFPQLR